MKFRKTPDIVEAIQWTGENRAEFQFFVNFNGSDLIRRGGELYLETLEGDKQVSKDDYVIKNGPGDFRSCKPDIFEMTYEAVDD